MNVDDGVADPETVDVGVIVSDGISDVVGVDEVV